MLKPYLFILVIVCTLLVAPARAETYQPLSPWNIHYGDTSCDLKRIFKSDTEEIQLQISQSFDLSGATLYLLTKSRDKKRYWEAEVDFLIEETGAKLTQGGQFLRIRKDQNLLVWQVYGFDLTFLEDLPDAVTLRLNSKRSPEVVLQLSGMKAIDAALEQCQRNLYTSFGLDYRQVEMLSRQPAPARSPGRWATAYDYPAEALRKGFEGTVQFLLTVDPEGRSQDCMILASSGHAVLDKQTCKVLMDRSQFIPALDQQGAPTTSTWISRVRWQIP